LDRRYHGKRIDGTGDLTGALKFASFVFECAGHVVDFGLCHSGTGKKVWNECGPDRKSHHHSPQSLRLLRPRRHRPRRRRPAEQLDELAAADHSIT